MQERGGRAVKRTWEGATRWLQEDAALRGVLKKKSARQLLLMNHHIRLAAVALQRAIEQQVADVAREQAGKAAGSAGGRVRGVSDHLHSRQGTENAEQTARRGACSQSPGCYTHTHPPPHRSIWCA